MALILAVAGCGGQSFAQEQPVNGLVARVDRVVLLDTDLDLARLAGLGGNDPTLAHLADRRVVLEQLFLDLESSGELERLGIDAEAATSSLRQRLPDDLPFSDEAIADLALRLAATESYIELRLARRIAISRSELEQLWASELGTLDNPPPIDEVRGQLERLLAERKLNAEIEEWEGTVATRWPAWCPACPGEGDAPGD